MDVKTIIGNVCLECFESEPREKMSDLIRCHQSVPRFLLSMRLVTLTILEEMEDEISSLKEENEKLRNALRELVKLRKEPIDMNTMFTFGPAFSAAIEALGEEEK